MTIRLYDTLHPDPIINTRGKVEMDPRIRIVFMGMLLGFTALFYWMLSLRVRVLRVERRRGEVTAPQFAAGIRRSEA